MSEARDKPMVTELREAAPAAPDSLRERVRALPGAAAGPCLEAAPCARRGGGDRRCGRRQRRDDWRADGIDGSEAECERAAWRATTASGARERGLRARLRGRVARPLEERARRIPRADAGELAALPPGERLQRYDVSMSLRVPRPLSRHADRSARDPPARRLRRGGRLLRRARTSATRASSSACPSAAPAGDRALQRPRNAPLAAHRGRRPPGAARPDRGTDRCAAQDHRRARGEELAHSGRAVQARPRQAHPAAPHRRPRRTSCARDLREDLAPADHPQGSGKKRGTRPLRPLLG